MRLLIISHTKEKDKDLLYGWVHRGLRVLPSLGIDIMYLFKKQWLDINKAYAKFKPDIILTLGPFAAYILYMKSWDRFGDTPVGHDWHDDYTITMGKRYGVKVMDSLQNYILKNSDFITTPSLARYGGLNTIMPNKSIFHWMHGSDVTGVSHEDKVPSLCKFVYIGELSESKNLVSLIDAFKDNHGSILYLYGKENKKLKLNNRVVYVTQLPFERIKEALDIADILVLPQDNDSTIKMSHYFAAKKPIIALIGGELDNYIRYINLYSSWEEAISIMESCHKKGNYPIVQYYPIKSEREYMSEYIKFLEEVVKNKAQQQRTHNAGLQA